MCRQHQHLLSVTYELNMKDWLTESGERRRCSSLPADGKELLRQQGVSAGRPGARPEPRAGRSRQTAALHQLLELLDGFKREGESIFLEKESRLYKAKIIKVLTAEISSTLQSRTINISCFSSSLTSTSTAPDPVQLRARTRRAVVANVAFMSTVASAGGEPVCVCQSALLAVPFTSVHILPLSKSVRHLWSRDQRCSRWEQSFSHGLMNS